MTYLEKIKIEEKRLKEENYKDLIKNIDNADYSYKIEHWANQFNFKKEDVKTEILNNKMFAMTFIKDPKKQNISEKIAADLLKTKILPQQEKKAIRFTEDGNIVNKKNINTTKSVDFIINDVYYSQKFTREDGGAQDNQFQDVIYFLKCGSKKNKVGAILDGSFYEDKKDYLKNYFRGNNNVRITSVDELRGEIK